MEKVLKTTAEFIWVDANLFLSGIPFSTEVQSDLIRGELKIANVPGYCLLVQEKHLPRYNGKASQKLKCITTSITIRLY